MTRPLRVLRLEDEALDAELVAATLGGWGPPSGAPGAGATVVVTIPTG